LLCYHHVFLSMVTVTMQDHLYDGEHYIYTLYIILRTENIEITNDKHVSYRYHIGDEKKDFFERSIIIKRIIHEENFKKNYNIRRDL